MRFAAGYWRRQPRRLVLIVAMLTVAAALETYLPNALSQFLGAIRHILVFDGGRIVEEGTNSL